MRVIIVIFAIAGIGLLTGGFLAFENVQRFVQAAAHTEGVVTGNVRQSGYRGGSRFYPRVRFRTEDGREVSFVSNVGTRPAIYRVNDAVKVIYDPRDPNRARIRSVINLWLVPIILGALGTLFSSVAGIVGVVKIQAARKAAWLQENGLPIQAEFTRVALDRSVRVNGLHPYRIVCQWLDPTANKVYIFESAAIWFDPTAYITTKTLQVVIDRGNPRRYIVDTGFLPKAG